MSPDQARVAAVLTVDPAWRGGLLLSLPQGRAQGSGSMGSSSWMRRQEDHVCLPITAQVSQQPRTLVNVTRGFLGEISRGGELCTGATGPPVHSMWKPGAKASRVVLRVTSVLGGPLGPQGPKDLPIPALLIFTWAPLASCPVPCCCSRTQPGPASRRPSLSARFSARYPTSLRPTPATAQAGGSVPVKLVSTRELICTIVSILANPLSLRACGPVRQVANRGPEMLIEEPASAGARLAPAG